MNHRVMPMRIVLTEQLAAVGDTRFGQIEAEASTGKRWRLALVGRRPAVAVLPVDYATRRVALVRQGSVGALGAVVLEAPSAVLRDGESSIEAARRKLEGLGIVARSIRLLATNLLVSPDYTIERMDLAIASGLTMGRRDDEAAAYMELVWTPFARLEDALATAEDLKTFALLQAFINRLYPGR